MKNCDKEFKAYHLFSINGPLRGEIAIGCMSPKWICGQQSVENGTLLKAYATFYVAPKQSYQ